MKVPSQTEIAKAAGVSQRTVAAVVGRVADNDTTHVSEKTRRHILAVAKKMNYLPNRAAQMMRGGRSNLIVHLNCGGYTELAGQRSYHIGRLTHEAGFDYQVVDSFWWPEEGERIIRSILSARPEGVIVSGSLQVEADFAPMLTTGIPIVGLETKIPNCFWVQHDARGAIAEITRRCLEHNRRPALLLREDLHYSTYNRQMGFLDALVDMGMTKMPTPKLLKASAKKTSRYPAIWLHQLGTQEFEPFESGMDAARLLLETECLPDALICSNDNYAIGAMTTLLRANIRIPSDIMVSGYDNLTYSRQGIVSLTTVEQPIEAMCGEALDFLTKQIRHPSHSKSLHAKSVHTCRIHWRQSMPLETDMLSIGFSKNELVSLS